MYPDWLLETRDIYYVDALSLSLSLSLEAWRSEDTSGGTRGTRIEWLENRNKEIYRSIERDE